MWLLFYSINIVYKPPLNTLALFTNAQMGVE